MVRGDQQLSKADMLKRVEAAKEQLEKIPNPKVKHHLQGFFDFVREQGVVGLAIGLVLGVAAKSVVDSVVNNIFNPIMGVLTGGVDFSDKFICIKRAGDACISKLGYGQVISDLISFMIAAAVIYFTFKALKLEKLDKKKDK